MENNIKEENCAKEKNNIEFSIAFNKDGDSFQNIIQKMTKKLDFHLDIRYKYIKVFIIVRRLF